MSHPFVGRVGGIVSADIAVPEHEREVQFYSRVLTTGDAPFWREDLMNNLGTPIIGLGKRIPEYEQLPLHWTPHLQVADVAASAARAVELGGTELMHGRDDEGRSQWAVLLDPDGACFGIIPVVTEEQLPPSGEEGQAVGCIAWLDLTVPDAAARREFYTEVIGWTSDDVGMNDEGDAYADYNMVAGDGEAAGGICHARGTNVDVPPVWMLYLPVGDLEESLRRVTDEGGEIVKASRAADGRYSTAVIRDPVGACLALAQG